MEPAGLVGQMGRVRQVRHGLAVGSLGRLSGASGAGGGGVRRRSGANVAVMYTTERSRSPPTLILSIRVQVAGSVARAFSERIVFSMRHDWRQCC